MPKLGFFAVEPLTVMISSRSSDAVPFNGRNRPLSDLRRAIKKRLEGIRLEDEPVFEVWIHEDEAVLPGDQNAWDSCMSRARRADILLVLYNGRAGWSGSSKMLGGTVGICHAEFAEAFYQTPSKVRSIQFPPIVSEPGSADERFQRDFTKQNLWGAQVATGEDALVSAGQAAVAALLDMARAGVGVGSRGSYFAGQALDWSRMDYRGRQAVTIETAVRYLSDRSTAKGERAKRRAGTAAEPMVIYPIDGITIALKCDCIPAAMSTAAARELVGQPFLRDHLWMQSLPKSVGGPVHVIACHRGVTEAQALRQLGFPDALVVSGPFGVYVADEVQKIQLAFIANCRDETTTRHGVQLFLQWLEQQGEDRDLARRAASRRRICDLIAKENSSTISK